MPPITVEFDQNLRLIKKKQIPVKSKNETLFFRQNENLLPKSFIKINQPSKIFKKNNATLNPPVQIPNLTRNKSKIGKMTPSLISSSRTQNSPTPNISNYKFNENLSSISPTKFDDNFQKQKLIDIINQRQK